MSYLQKYKIKKQPEILTPAQSSERVKLFYDFFKHITTLNTGTFILIAILAEKFTITHQFTKTLAQALIFLFGSILGSLMVMTLLPSHAGGSKIPRTTNLLIGFGALISVAAFGAALLSLQSQLLQIARG